jgi:hypothetical protein
MVFNGRYSLDNSNARSHTGNMQDASCSAPIVALRNDRIAEHPLCWELHERAGSWYAWVSWDQATGDPVRHRHRHRHKVVGISAARLTPIEPPES